MSEQYAGSDHGTTTRTDVLRVGIIGCSAVAQAEHMPVLARLPGTRVTALAEPNPARARAHHQVPAPAIFENAPELPATAAVDAVKTLHQGMGCRFSIIVPTHDRPERLLWCLEALAALHCPRERFEVIVVNDGGAMPAARRLAQLAERVQLTIVSQERAGPAHARNLGVEQARGEYLAFTDDDCAPTPEWLAALEEAFLEAPDALVGGRTVNVLDGNLCSEASQLLIEYLYGYYNGPLDRGGNFFASNNLAISARSFRDLRGFDSSFGRAGGEDRDLCARWRLTGGQFHYARSAVVRHAHALTLGAFARQHFAYGRGAFQFRMRHIQRGGDPIRIEPLTFYTGLLEFAFQRYRPWRAAPVGVLMGISQVANAAGFFWERRSQGGRQDRREPAQS